MTTQTPSGRGFLIALNDLIAAAILVIWGLVLGPLGILRGTLYLGNAFWYIWVLSPQGLLSRFMKAAIDWRLGNFDSAVFQLEFLVTRVENAFGHHPKSRPIRIVLEDFYTLLVRAYLHGGHIDDAMLVILRAKKTLDCDRLPELARLDAKTAHLVRAGLAAGRLLDGGGLATLYVKAADPAPSSPNRNKNAAKTPTIPHRQGATARNQETTGTGNIIPFPKIQTNNDANKNPEL